MIVKRTISIPQALEEIQNSIYFIPWNSLAHSLTIWLVKSVCW